MLCFRVVFLTTLFCALQCATAERESQCPPSAMKIEIVTDLTNTSVSPIVSLTEVSYGRPSWKVSMDHRTIEGNNGNRILLSTFNLYASETRDSFDVPEFEGGTPVREIVTNNLPSSEKEQHKAHPSNDIQKGASIFPPLHRSSEKSVQGYDYYRGLGYYKFHHGVTTWPAARNTCAQEGGHLVIINSEAERGLVQFLFSDLNPISEGSSDPNQIHVGLKRVGEGKYETIFGVPMEETGFSEWTEGQPSGGATEPCVSYMKRSMKYNDISCYFQILAFICEIESHNGRISNNGLDVIQIGTDKQPIIITPKPLEVEAFPLGYELFPDVGFYKFHHGVDTWPAARDMCAREGGHLVIINSEAEREVIRKLFVERNPISEGSSNSNQIHAGLRRVGEGNYTTIYGVPMEETGFSVWSPGQPSSGDREPCVSIMKKTIAYNDISCRIQILAYICEVEIPAH